MQIMKTRTQEKQRMPGCGSLVPGGFSRLCRNVSLAAGSCLLSALLLLAGCSKESMPEPGGGNDAGKVAVSFEVEGLSEIATKAALATNTTVRVFAYQSGKSPASGRPVADQAYYWSGSELRPCLVDANGNKKDFPLGVPMKLLPGKYDFYAVSPALSLSADNGVIISVTNGVDYAATTSKKTQEIPSQLTPYTITLDQLDRQCVQVKLILEQDNSYLNSAISTVNVNSVKMSGLSPNKGIYVGGSIIASSSGAPVLTLAQKDFSASGSTYTANFCLLPLRNGKLKFEVDMDVNGVNMIRTGELTAVTLEKSKTYTMTAKILSSALDISLTANSWSNENNNNPSFGYPYVEDGKIIVMEDRYGSASDYPLHGPWTVTPTHAESEATSNDSGMNTVSSRFEVSYDGTYQMTWGNAVNKCTDGWRLPTIRELEVIYDMRSRLDLDYPFNNYDFWTATEGRDNIYAWAKQVGSSGTRGLYYKDKRLFAVCCVRDL